MKTQKDDYENKHFDLQYAITKLLIFAEVSTMLYFAVYCNWKVQ